MTSTPILIEKTTVNPLQEQEQEQDQPPPPPQRIDSFPSLSMEELADADGIDGIDIDDDLTEIIENDNELETGGQPSSSSSSSLMEENERLRAQVAQLKDKVTVLQSRNTTSTKRHTTGRGRRQRANSETDVNMSSPRPSTLLVRQQAGRNNNNAIRQNQNQKPRQIPPLKKYVSFPKEDRSLDTAHDRETVEPYMDLEAHRSADGLHHRSHYNNNTNGVGSPNKKASPSFDDDSIHSNSESLEDDDDDDDDDDHEQDGLLTRTAASSSDNDNHIEHDNNEEDFVKDVWDRAGWLVGLLFLQSMSSFILAHNEALLQKHVIIVRFLTMLVGAGGNAGNQASVRVIRGLAVGKITDANTKSFLRKEIKMVIWLSLILGTAGCIRAAIFMTPILETLAITTSLLMIVSISIVLGSLLPLGMKKVRIDPAHSSTSIQVIMDIIGVTIIVMVSRSVYWLSGFLMGSSNIEDER